MSKRRLSGIALFVALLSLTLLVPTALGTAPELFAQDAAAPKARLSVTDNLATDDKELFLETPDWKVGFSLFFNGGVHRLFDKVADPEMKDDLLTGPHYCQGGIFDYDVYLTGFQEFMTSMGRNRKLGGESLQVIENTPVRARLKQTCHPRLNNGSGPPGDPYPELAMVLATTEWTFYPTGRVNIKFDAIVDPKWTGIIDQGPGGDGKGISTDGFLIKAGGDGHDFNVPWVTVGDTIESQSGGWGPLEITRRQDKLTLRIPRNLPKSEKLDYIIRRPFIDLETISIHADGGTNKKPREQCWLGGSNGVPVFNLNKMGDIQRGNVPPLKDDYVFAHWTVEARGFGSSLAFNETYNADFAVVNDNDWGDISYTQYGIGGGRRPFAPHHRHFQAQLGIRNGKATPRIKSVADALPFADDYRHPFAAAKLGTLKTGDGISKFGYHVPTGAYQITAKNKAAAIGFDAARGKTSDKPLAYPSPAVLVFGLNTPDNRLAVEWSKDNGRTYQAIPAALYNITARAEAPQLGGDDRRLFQLLETIPATAAGAKAWVIRIRAK